MMQFQEYFKTPIYVEEKPEWVDPINKVCDPYIKEAKELKENKEQIKKQKGSDFGVVAHSYSIVDNPHLKEYITYMGNRSWEFLDVMGYDLTNHTCVFTDMWVQEFPKDGGGHHNSHVHPNNHVSGFFYLHREDTSPLPVFHDPRPAALICALPEKNAKEITYASQAVNWKPMPGTLIIQPSYITHQYSVGGPNNPFRFIHFNIQAINNKFMKEIK
tara:strand:+ start:199 stop:846 length:648 start_codon:yes stop_codon:yes gene_type:complete